MELALLHDQSSGTMGEIALISFQSGQIHGQRDPLFLPPKRKRICEIEGLHYRRNLVIPVVPKPQNIERQIDLRPSENRHHRKSFLHCLEDYGI